MFWCIFLDKWSPNARALQGFFNRIAHNYVKLMLYCRDSQYKETFLKVSPSLSSFTFQSIWKYFHRFRSTRICYVKRCTRPSSTRFRTRTASSTKTSKSWSHLRLLSGSKVCQSFVNLSDQTLNFIIQAMYMYVHRHATNASTLALLEPEDARTWRHKNARRVAATIERKEENFRFF